MAKQKNIHAHMRDRMLLAKVYAQDGAFHTAADILGALAVEVKKHADWADAAVKALVADYEKRHAGDAP